MNKATLKMLGLDNEINETSDFVSAFAKAEKVGSEVISMFFIDCVNPSKVDADENPVEDDDSAVQSVIDEMGYDETLKMILDTVTALNDAVKVRVKEANETMGNDEEAQNIRRFNQKCRIYFARWFLVAETTDDESDDESGESDVDAEQIDDGTTKVDELSNDQFEINIWNVLNYALKSISDTDADSIALSAKAHVSSWLEHQNHVAPEAEVSE